MKILVFGCGVVGSYLIHILCRAGNEVTVLARAHSAKILRKYGLRIKHKLQNTKSIDYPQVITELSGDERYDLVFSAMQGQQQKEVLPMMADIDCPMFILVGNDLTAAESEREFIELTGGTKTLLFGFQSTGGVRMHNYTICSRSGKGSMTIGGLHREPAFEERRLISSAFGKTGFSLKYTDDMEGWLYCHAAAILPMIYVGFTNGFSLKNEGAAGTGDIVKAVSEGLELIRRVGIQIRPAEMEKPLNSPFRSAAIRILMLAASKTKIGELTASEHCRSSISEMEYLDKHFNELRRMAPDHTMPAWNKLRSKMLSWEQIHSLYEK